MKTKKFYVLSLFAVLRKPPAEGEGLFQFEAGVGAWTALAASAREAVEQGERKALEKWPVEAGWTSHTCTAGEITREELVAILAELS